MICFIVYDFKIRPLTFLNKWLLDVGMNDAVSAGAWPERENPHLTRVNEVCEYVKQVRVKTYKIIISTGEVTITPDFWGFKTPGT